MSQSANTTSHVVEAALQRLNEQSPYISVGVGAPPEAGWITLESVGEPGALQALINRTLEDAEDGTPEHVAGNYLFRYLLSGPLLAAGYLFAQHAIVPALAGNVLFRNSEWLQHTRLVEPRIVAGGSTGTDAGSGTETLRDALFAEIANAYGPVIDVFRERGYVATSNAWGSILDALIQGFLAAGSESLGEDEAWRRWEDVIRDRAFPLRRRPRRFSCDINGIHEERAIRAGCCLWYMVPASQQGQGYCATCYLMSDERRMEIIAAYQHPKED